MIFIIKEIKSGTLEPKYIDNSVGKVRLDFWYGAKTTPNVKCRR